MIGIGEFTKRKNVRGVITHEGQRLYMGKKYSIEKSTGYYACTTGKSRQRLHDAMWIHENTAGLDRIPEGHVVHHIDWDKTHNEISNLTCVSVQGHNLIHNPPKDNKDGKGKYRVNIVPGGLSEVIKLDETSDSIDSKDDV